MKKLYVEEEPDYAALKISRLTNFIFSHLTLKAQIGADGPFLFSECPLLAEGNSYFHIDIPVTIAVLFKYGLHVTECLQCDTVVLPALKVKLCAIFL